MQDQEPGDVANVTHRWKTDSSKGYSPTKFYTGSKDDQGHGTTLHIKVPDYMIPRLQSIKQDLKKHYKTHNDIFRDALRHRIEYLENNMDAISSDPEQRIYDDLDFAETYAAKIKTFNALPGKIRGVCKSLKAAGATFALKEYVGSMATSARQYPEPWRSMVLEELDSHSRDLL